MNDEYLMLSGIQHFAFCPRQWALIHVEQQWKENVRMSRPAWGEWIEIRTAPGQPPSGNGLAPRGASGLKLRQPRRRRRAPCVSPRVGRVD